MRERERESMSGASTPGDSVTVSVFNALQTLYSNSQRSAKEEANELLQNFQKSVWQNDKFGILFGFWADGRG